MVYMIYIYKWEHVAFFLMLREAHIRPLMHLLRGQCVREVNIRVSCPNLKKVGAL